MTPVVFRGVCLRFRRVSDVSVSPPSVGVLGEDFSSDSDCEIVKP